MKQIREKTPEHVQKLILANKCDLGESEREVKMEEGEKLAEDLSTDTDHIDFMEVSAKSGENIDQAFSLICRKIKGYNEEFSKEEYGKKSEIVRVTVDKNT